MVWLNRPWRGHKMTYLEKIFFFNYHWIFNRSLNFKATQAKHLPILFFFGGQLCVALDIVYFQLATFQNSLTHQNMTQTISFGSPSFLSIDYVAILGSYGCRRNSRCNSRLVSHFPHSNSNRKNVPADLCKLGKFLLNIYIFRPINPLPCGVGPIGPTLFWW